VAGLSDLLTMWSIVQVRGANAGFCAQRPSEANERTAQPARSIVPSEKLLTSAARSSRALTHQPLPDM